MSELKIFALGGLDEDGKNMFILEDDQDIFVIECGLKYPNATQLGIEMVIPDFSYLVQNANKVRAIFITHGHDDVMAALPNLCRLINVPIYTGALTAQILKNKFHESGIKDRDIHVIKRNGTYKIANHKVKTFGVTQSIADAFGLAILTSQGYVVYTSEFIVDFDCRGKGFDFDINVLSEISSQGVLALMAESVGSGRNGHASPNHRLTPQIEPSFEDTEQRIVVTMYNQNLFRVIEVLELAKKFNRKVFIYDDALCDVLHYMQTLGYYDFSNLKMINQEEFNNDMQDVLVIVAGSGATIFKKVHRIAIHEDPVITLSSNDTIVIASPMVPGTEKEGARMEDDLFKESDHVVVVDSKRMFSMHAASEDLKMMISLLRPKYYIPVKGEYRQLVSNALIATQMDYSPNNILVLDNGQIAKFSKGNCLSINERIECVDQNIDGKDSLDSAGLILKDRETLSTDGAIICGVLIDYNTKELIAGPDVQTRGFIYLKDANDIITEIGNIFVGCISDLVEQEAFDNMEARQLARDRICKYVFKETGKRPMVLPSIIEINGKRLNERGEK